MILYATRDLRAGAAVLVYRYDLCDRESLPLVGLGALSFSLCIRS